MQLIRSNDSIPRRKRKVRRTPFDKFEPFRQLTALMLSGELRPGQQVGIVIDENDAKTLDMKEPWRIAVLRLKRLLRDAGLEDDYHVVKFETDTPGKWFVKVTHAEQARRLRGNALPQQGKQRRA